MARKGPREKDKGGRGRQSRSFGKGRPGIRAPGETRDRGAGTEPRAGRRVPCSRATADTASRRPRPVPDRLGGTRPHRSLCDSRNLRAKRDRWPFPGQHPAPFAGRPPPARVSISATVRSPSKPSRPFPAPRWFSGGGAAPHGAKVAFPKARSREVAGPSCGSRNSPLRSLRRCHVRAAASVCPSLGFSFCQTRPLTSGSESSCEDPARLLTEAGDPG